MVIKTLNKQIESIFNADGLPNYIFNKKYKYFYFFEQTLFGSYLNSSELQLLFENIFTLFNEEKIYINKLFSNENLKYTPEIVVRKEGFNNDFSFAMSIGFELNRENTMHSFTNSYENPTIIYGDSKKWFFYFLYEDELILLASEVELNIQSIISDDIYIRNILNWNNGIKREYLTSQHFEFVKKLKDNYSPI